MKKSMTFSTGYVMVTAGRVERNNMGGKEWIYAVTEAVLALVYPPRCPVCDEIVAFEDRGKVHPECRKKLFYITGAVCLNSALTAGKNIIITGRERVFSYIKGTSNRPCTGLNIPIRESMQLFLQGSQQNNTQNGCSVSEQKLSYRFRCTEENRSSADIIRQKYLQGNFPGGRAFHTGWIWFPGCATRSRKRI